ELRTRAGRFHSVHRVPDKERKSQPGVAIAADAQRHKRAHGTGGEERPNGPRQAGERKACQATRLAAEEPQPYEHREGESCCAPQVARPLVLPADPEALEALNS